MKITNNQDIFNQVDDIIKKLNKANSYIWAEKLSKALVISFMPGEIFEELHFQLTELQKSGITKQIKMDKEISGIIQALKRALQNT